MSVFLFINDAHCFSDGTLGEVAQNGVDISTASPPQEFPSATEPAVEARQDEETFPSVTVETPEQDNKSVLLLIEYCYCL